MIVVNLFGAPGAGKSTGAAYIFSRLKMADINVELVTEFAKDKVWEGSRAVFENQAYIFGKQYFRISRLGSQVDVVVTDSPLMNSVFYNSDDLLGNELDALVTKVFNSYQNVNFFVYRCKTYNPIGRFQTEEESDIAAENLEAFLKDHHIEAESVPGSIDGYDRIVDTVIKLLERENDYDKNNA